jgi:hypothetical protein
MTRQREGGACGCKHRGEQQGFANGFLMGQLWFECSLPTSDDRGDGGGRSVPQQVFHPFMR